MKKLLLTGLLLLVGTSFAAAYIPGEDELEKYMVELLNQERVARGLNFLKRDEIITQASRQHSREMRDKKYFSHTSPVPANREPTGRLRAAGVTDVANAENIGLYSTNEKINLRTFTLRAHKGLMNSPKHKKNILTPQYNYVGVGIIRGKRDRLDTVWVTQNFVHRQLVLQPLSREVEGDKIAFYLSGEELTSQALVVFPDDAKEPRELEDNPGKEFSTVVSFLRNSGKHLIKLGVITERGKDFFGYEVTNELTVDTGY